MAHPTLAEELTQKIRLLQKEHVTLTVAQDRAIALADDLVQFSQGIEPGNLSRRQEKDLDGMLEQALEIVTAIGPQVKRAEPHEGPPAAIPTVQMQPDSRHPHSGASLPTPSVRGLNDPRSDPATDPGSEPNERLSSPGYRAPENQAHPGYPDRNRDPRDENRDHPRTQLAQDRQNAANEDQRQKDLDSTR